jgi:hypothetical protein
MLVSGKAREDPAASNWDYARPLDLAMRKQRERKQIKKVPANLGESRIGRNVNYVRDPFTDKNVVDPFGNKSADEPNASSGQESKRAIDPLTIKRSDSQESDYAEETDLAECPLSSKKTDNSDSRAQICEHAETPIKAKKLEDPFRSHIDDANYKFRQLEDSFKTKTAQDPFNGPASFPRNFKQGEHSSERKTSHGQGAELARKSEPKSLSMWKEQDAHAGFAAFPNLTAIREASHENLTLDIVKRPDWAPRPHSGSEKSDSASQDGADEIIDAYTAGWI